jgi:glycosyltransferase involved in cell wall biosynthesis
MSLRKIIAENHLNSRVFMPGHIVNVTDYLASADFLLHPSISESSCVVVKEAGISKLPSIVCEGVGDFDDYVENGENGFVVPKDDFVNCASDIVVEYHLEKEKLDRIKHNMNEKVLELFSIENVLPKYEGLNA